ncbi:MAG: zinc ABC transporter substrate-binding protein [Saprospiraceae bacterium]|nr:zinc ABC transporter substrate-binding protein [Saprospiraceae bacterium]
MKTAINLTLVLLCFSSCLLAQTPTKTVVATASIFADMAENIAGGHVTVKTIVPVGGDPHIYEPTPADARLVASADLILKNSLTFEGWLDGLIANANTKAKVVTITEGIEAIQSAHKNSSDPHAWMSAANGLIYIENIKNALVDLDPAHREVYEFNYGVYRKQLEDLDAYIAEQVKKIPEQRRILITSHDAFEYYGKRYGLRLESVLGISTDAEAQTSDMVRLANVMKESGVPAVFIETTVNPKLLSQIAKDNKVRIGGKLFSDSIGPKGSDAPSYYEMLKYNTDTIVKALSAADGTKTEEEQIQPKSGIFTWSLLALLLIGGFVFVAKKMNK